MQKSAQLLVHTLNCYLLLLCGLSSWFFCFIVLWFPHLKLFTAFWWWNRTIMWCWRRRRHRYRNATGCLTAVLPASAHWIWWVSTNLSSYCILIDCWTRLMRGLFRHPLSFVRMWGPNNRIYTIQSTIALKITVRFPPLIAHWFLAYILKHV